MPKVAVATSATAEPLSLAVIKAHLRIYDSTTYTEENSYLNAINTAARKWVENVTWRKIMRQTLDLYLDEFPTDYDDSIELPYGNLQSVTSVTYTNSTNQTITFSTANYSLDKISTLGRIVLNSSASWPSDNLHPNNPIKIRFVCGYSSSSSNVPADLLHAIKFMVSNLYENRESELISRIINRIPRGIESLLANYKLNSGY